MITISATCATKLPALGIPIEVFYVPDPVLDPEFSILALINILGR